MTMKSDAKFEEKLTCCLGNDMRALESVKIGTLRDPFAQSRKCMTLKFTEELCVMTMKNNVKFEEELTCHFKTGMRNLTNFEEETDLPSLKLT